MTAMENLLRLIELLPEDKLEQLERFAISLLAEASEAAEPAPGRRATLEEALERTNAKYGEALRRLADS